MRTDQLVEVVALAIRGGVEPGLSPDGVLQLQVDGEDGTREAFLSVRGGLVDIGQGYSPEACSSIRLDESLAKAFCGGYLELRDDAIRNRLRLRGNWAFVASMLSACMRPSPHTVSVFREAAAKAQGMDYYWDETLAAPNEQMLRRNIETGYPLVTKGGLTWQPIGWNFHKLDSAFGHCKLDIGVLLGDVIERMVGGQIVYTHGCKVPDELARELSLDFLPRKRRGGLQLWMGSHSPRLVTGLHREVLPAFLVQVIGRKKLILFGPNQEKFVYGRRTYGTLQQCWINLDEPDLVKFPLFVNARPLEIVLNPGDTLLIPPGWFHCAYALDDVMSISTVLL